MSSLFGNKGPPGGLSINTAAANSPSPGSTQPPPPSGSLFGQPKPGGSLFGASTSTSAAGTLFGASTAASTQSTSLFGNTATASSSAGTLFGGAAANNNAGNAAAPNNTAAAGSLFGNTGAQTQAPPSGGLFGGSLFSNRPAAAAQPATTSLFGSLGSSQPQPGSSFFGSGPGMQPQQAKPSLFGSLNQPPPPQQQQQQQPQQSIFGSLNQSQQQQHQQQQQTQNQPTTSLFGAANTSAQPSFNASNVSTIRPSQQPQRSIFSASIGQYTQAAQTVPGVRVDLSSLKPTTRFEDLTDEAQQVITRLDEAFQQQMSYGDECGAAMPAAVDRGTAIAPDVEFLQQKLEAVKNSLLSDAAAIDEAKNITRADAGDAARSFRAIQALRVPAQLSTRPSVQAPSPPRDRAPSGSAADPAAPAADGQSLVAYFSRRSEELAARLAQLRTTLREIEGYVGSAEAQAVEQAQSLRMGRGLDGASAGRSKDEKLRELVGVLREFERAIVVAAGNISKAREQTDELRQSKQRGRPGLRY